MRRTVLPQRSGHRKAEASLCFVIWEMVPGSPWGVATGVKENKDPCARKPNTASKTAGTYSVLKELFIFLLEGNCLAASGIPRMQRKSTPPFSVHFLFWDVLQRRKPKWELHKEPFLCHPSSETSHLEGVEDTGCYWTWFAFHTAVPVLTSQSQFPHLSTGENTQLAVLLWKS